MPPEHRFPFAATVRCTLPWLDEVALAVVFLTRLPLRLARAPAADGLARAMGWFPLVGAGLGLAGGVVYALATGVGLPPAVAGLLALAALAALTGALHEDGLADVADGFGGGRGERDRTLAIMRDSRVGSFGALALVFSVGLRATALAGLAVPGAVVAALVAAGALSRVLAAVLARALPLARPDGLAARAARPPVSRVRLALGLGAGLGVAACGIGPGVAAAGAVALVAVVVARMALGRIGGITGDVHGAAQQAAETAVLLTLLALR
jgi:adenosylcobinamide-GDP ribazoletransferase